MTGPHSHSLGRGASSVQGADLVCEWDSQGRLAQHQGQEDLAAWQWKRPLGWTLPWISPEVRLTQVQVLPCKTLGKLPGCTCSFCLRALAL